MKATLKNIIQAYSGKCDGLVFYYNPRLDRMLVRTLPDWKPTESNRRLSSVASNLKSLNISPQYRLDLIAYTELYRREHRDNNCSGWYNLFNKLMWAMSKQLNIDLESLSKVEITNDDLPCRSVKRAVEAGLLPPVTGWERLDAEI